MSITDQTFLFGFVLFFHLQDKTNKQVYSPKSIVVVSEYYNKLAMQNSLKQIKKVYFSEKLSEIPFNKRLEVVFEHIKIKKDDITSINIVNELLENDEERIKENLSKLKAYDPKKDSVKNFNLFPENNKFIESLSMHYICKVWNLWELVITESPIVVYSDLPSTCG